MDAPATGDRGAALLEGPFPPAALAQKVREGSTNA
jgi:hypothetical protein